MDILEKLKRSIAMALDECYGYGVTLCEMADPASKVKTRIADLSKQIFKHIMKLIMYGKEEQNTIHHWCHELNNWLEQCVENKVKRIGKATYPTKEELYQWLHYHYKDGDDIRGSRTVLENEYTYQGHTKRDISDQELYEKIDSFLKEICPIIVTHTCTDDNVEEIIRKYFI